ncbi:hypothetical protein BUE80_DR001813 [Diplocarpon rosae]|nr:hypothetical protein BUE80_DR001813 [Diplocarpon rosae]
MAEGAVAPVLANGATLNAEELREILEYERIVQFRDAVLAGTHPRIKIPAHLAGKQAMTRSISSPNSSTPRPNQGAQPARNTPGSRLEDSPSFQKSPINIRSAVGAHVPMSSKSEINPILLEKSDDLIKAEIQLQRQRLERGLREQIDQQRIATKALLQTSESLPSFDISEVLSQALTIVHPSTTAEVELSGVASDSFDENTFYSSQHDTPDIPSPPQGRKGMADVESHSAPLLEQRGISATQNQSGDREVIMTGTSLSNDNNVAKQVRTQTQHSQAQNSTPNRREQVPVTGNSELSSLSGENISSDAHGTVKATTRDMLKQAFDKVATSPLIRAHNLSPIAPQPARVSPLATTKEPPIPRETTAVQEIQPVQVSALRTRQNGQSSTDSSPKGVKEKRKEKKNKKKRKGKEPAEAPDSPYIKPEPRSPSPYNAAVPSPRPQKRPRRSGQHAPELNYDEPHYEPAVGGRQHNDEERYREMRVSRTYERSPERYEPAIRRPRPVYRHTEREVEGEFRRVPHPQYGRRPHSPGYAPLPYAVSNARRAGEPAVLERLDVDNGSNSIDLTRPIISRDELNHRSFRASVRPEADRERSRSPIYRERRSPISMAPPRQPMRIIIDEFGRKYYEPVAAPSLRQSMAPPVSYREGSVIYERAPLRTVSSRVPTEYTRDGVVYRASSPTPVVPRRVVTQPEYALPGPPEYRAYRQREYSARPTAMAPPSEEYVQIRGRPMSPAIERREYVQRAPSAYPEVRYEIPREYARVQSVRPEGPPRDYAASVRPEPRREMIPQVQREYSVRPVDAIPIPRRQIVAEGDRYYEEEAMRRPAEVAFVERPRVREASVMVYADDVRRDVYR